jgi:hypothetical protein
LGFTSSNFRKAKECPKLGSIFSNAGEATKDFVI